MAPQIGQRARLNGKDVVWSGNHGWQSPPSYNKLKEDGAFRFGAQELNRLTSSIADSRVVKAISSFQDRVAKETDKIPGVKQVAELADKALNRSPQGVVSRGAGILTDNAASAANVDPRLATAGLLLLGRVQSGPNWRRPTASDVRKATGGQLRAEIGLPGKKEPVRPSPPASNNAAQAARAEAAVRAKALSDRGTIAERQRVAEALKGVNVAQEARGPASKQFGAHNISDTWDPAAEGLVTGGGGSAAGGRPSASQSSPHLRELKEGVRKQTGQSRVREALDQRRGQGSPGKASPPQPIPVSPERSARVTQALQRQQERQAQRQGTTQLEVNRQADYGLDQGNRPTKPREGVLREGGENPAPIRRDAQGNRIPEPKAERQKPTSRGSRSRPANRPLNYQGQKPERLTQAEREALLRENSSPDVRGTLGGEIKTKGTTPPAQRSKGAQAQTRSTLKALLQRALGAGNLNKASRIKALLKNLK